VNHLLSRSRLVSRGRNSYRAEADRGARGRHGPSVGVGAGAGRAAQHRSATEPYVVLRPATSLAPLGAGFVSCQLCHQGESSLKRSANPVSALGSRIRVP